MSPGKTLFRNILREHRRLPPPMRVLGDRYVREEFKQHANAKPEHLSQFMNGWNNYLSQLKQQQSSFGADIDQTVRSKMTPEQVSKLNSLKNEADKLAK
mmetsp:Transcript_26780/g.39729  ORF Transcript_26780/g.39729 Transcript_26780/m.39729 type:complete len:99 (+) Transcript_26780:83-379(+)